MQRQEQVAGLCLGRGGGGKPKAAKEARQRTTVAPGGLGSQRQSAA